MKIYIPYHLDGVGGPYTFVRLFKKLAADAGHTVTTTYPRTYDVLLVIAACPLTLALRAKQQGKPILQRLDGVYHPGIPGINGYIYPLKNIRMKIIHNYVADHIIYQSKFSRLSCRAMLGTPTTPSTIIYNAAPTALVVKPAPPSPTLRLVTLARFRRKDQIQPILDALQYLSIPYHLSVYGAHTEALAPTFAKISAHPHMTYHGSLAHNNVLTTLMNHDIFLFSDLSQCPHAVLEALGASLPVVAYNRGGVAELIEPHTSGELADVPPHNPFRDFYPFTETSYREFAERIEHVAGQLAHYRSGAWTAAQQNFSPASMMQRYLALCSQFA